MARETDPRAIRGSVEIRGEFYFFCAKKELLFYILNVKSSRSGRWKWPKMELIKFLLLFVVGKSRGQCPLVCHCDDHDKTATCVQQGLDAVPENLPWFVQELSLSENQIQRLPKDAFPKKSNIQECGLIFTSSLVFIPILISQLYLQLCFNSTILF